MRLPADDQAALGLSGWLSKWLKMVNENLREERSIREMPAMGSACIRPVKGCVTFERRCEL
jgi:hypothetical protein